MGPFRLFPEPQRWFTFADYQLVLDCMRELKPQRVLEFGPGSSTLALIEGGARHIDTLEDQDDWAAVWQERLVDRFPDVVRLHRFSLAKGNRVIVPAFGNPRYDLALVDGPRDTTQRGPAIQFALNHATCVLVTDQTNSDVRERTEQLVKKFRPRRALVFRDVAPEMRRIAWIHPEL